MAVQSSLASPNRQADSAPRRVALILDGHGWASRAVVNSLSAGGWRVLAPARTKSCRSRFCAASVRLPDYMHDAAAFVESVSTIIRQAEVDLVVPGEDASLELVYETVGLLGNARVLGGDRDSVRLVLDKARTLGRAEQAGFGIPRCVEARSVDDAVAGARELGFPCVVKPRRSYARVGNGFRAARLRFASDPVRLRRLLEDYLRQGFEMPLVQEWVQGRSIGVATVVRHGRVLAWGAREAFSQCPIRGGSAVWRATVGPEEPGIAEALELMRSIGFEGLGDVQYHIAADGGPRLMEIGARTYGWLPLTIAAGADLPLIAARALEGVEPAEVVMARPGLHMRWGRGELVRIGELLQPRVQLPPGSTRRQVLRQLRPLLGADMRYDGWTMRDRRLRLSGRRARRQRLPERAEVVAGLERIESAAWDRLVRPGQGALAHAFLRAWERAELAGLASRPIVVRASGGGPMAATAGYLYDLDMAAVSHPFLPRLIGGLRRLWPRLLITRAYELGAPAAHNDPLLLAQDADPSRAAAAIVGAFVGHAEEAGARMLIVQDFIDPHGPLAAALRGHGFASVVALPTSVVEIAGYRSFEEYLGAMRSRYRRRTKCVLRDSRHLRPELVGDFAPLAGELASLWRLVYDRAGETKREILTPEFFAAAADLPETSALLLRRPDESIAIFGLLMEDRPWLHFLQCGFPEEAGRGESAYFRLLLEIVRTAIEGGFEHAHLGCTTLGPKLDVGAEPVGLSAWIRHRNPLLQRLFVMGGNGRFAPAPVTPRRVFSADGA